MTMTGTVDEIRLTKMRVTSGLALKTTISLAAAFVLMSSWVQAAANYHLQSMAVLNDVIDYRTHQPSCM